MNLSHLTDNELTAQLTLRGDLSALERELLGRLVRALETMDDMVAEDEGGMHGNDT